MRQKSNAILCCLSIYAFLFLHPISSDAQEVLDERDFNYIQGGDLGPAHWGNIKPEWETCKTGKLQSPIDMTHPRVTLMVLYTDTETNYKAGPSMAYNRGHDIMLEWKGDAGTAKINNTLYKLWQIHWHSPSEHSIDGKRYAMELHMVHTSQDPKAEFPIAVIGGFYDIGEPDPFLAKVIPYLRPLQSGENKTHAGVIDPNEILINNERSCYRYIGSLTIPPCTEGVLWTLKERIMSISKEQITLFRDAVHDSAEENARPLQPANDRPINLFTPLL